jgi:soluble lytic murein transglycosylase
VLLVVSLIALPLALVIPDVIRQVMYPLRYEGEIRTAAEEHGLEPAFLAGVIYTESRFRPDATSHRGAYGLMQLLPGTARHIQRRSGIQGDWRAPGVNLRVGAWYLGHLEERYSGDERRMLAAYNSGETQVDIWDSEEGFDIEKDIPFRETRDYVENVFEAEKTYAELYGRNLDRRQE